MTTTKERALAADDERAMEAALSGPRESHAGDFVSGKAFHLKAGVDVKAEVIDLIEGLSLPQEQPILLSLRRQPMQDQHRPTLYRLGTKEQR